MSALPLTEPLRPADRDLRVLPVPVTDPPPLMQPYVATRQEETEPLDFVNGPGSVPAGQNPAADGELPDPHRAAATLAVAVVEVLNGLRPPSQLTRWTSQDVQSALARRAAVNARMSQQPRTRRPPVVKGVRVCRPDPNVAETSAVVFSPDRVRALAIRLEATEGRWRATALEIG